MLNAPFEERGWERAVQAVADATGSSAAHLLGIGGPLLMPLNVFAGDVAGVERYATDPRFHGAINWRVATATTPLAIQYEKHYEAYRALHDTSDYDDVASDLDIQYGCQSAAILDQNNLLGIALLRSRRDGPCTADTLERFARLRRAMARSVRLQLALDGEAAELMLNGVGSLSAATILLDRHGVLSALTPAAEPLFDDPGPLRLDAMMPRLRCREGQARFQVALTRIYRSRADGTAVEQLRVGKWRLAIVALPTTSHGLGFEPHVAITVRASGPSA